MIDADQIAEWEWFYELEPWGALQEDRRAARIASVIGNRIPFQGKSAKAVREAELFASLKPPEADGPETPKIIARKVTAFATALGGRTVKAADFRREWEEKRKRQAEQAKRPAGLPGKGMLRANRPTRESPDR